MKHCNRCDRDLPATAFARRGQGLQPYCKECNSKYYSELYKNSEARRQSVKGAVGRMTAEKLAYVRSVLATGCVDCGNKDIRVLEFDHLEDVDKVDGVGRLARQGASMTRIKAEIEKCEIVCRNCHAIRTHTRAGWTWGLPLSV